MPHYGLIISVTLWANYICSVLLLETFVKTIQFGILVVIAIEFDQPPDLLHKLNTRRLRFLLHLMS